MSRNKYSYGYPNGDGTMPRIITADGHYYEHRDTGEYVPTVRQALGNLRLNGTLTLTGVAKGGLFRGTADTTPHTIEERVIDGQCVKVKVYK